MKAQRAQLAKALIRIAPDVTAADRAECVKKLKLSKVTISYYLGGQVTNNDRALRLLEFLTNRIETRQLEIQALCNNKISK